MRSRRILCLVVIMLISLCFVFVNCAQKAATESSKKSETTREPVVAGAFYPGGKAELQEMVDEFLRKAKKEKITGVIIALIAPHAGYQFSGQVAAYAYKQIDGLKFDSVVLIGGAHQVPPERDTIAALPEEDYWQTPLGKVKVNTSLAKELVKKSKEISFYSRAHSLEHSLEVQLPFLQRTLKDYQILPLMMDGNAPLESCKKLSETLGKVLKGKNTLLVASSDMSHYPKYEDANRVDKEILAAIETFEAHNVRKKSEEIMRRGIPQLVCTLCGEAAVETVMMTAKNLGADKVKVIKYANSGDVPAIGDKSRVVGYGAVIMYKSKTKSRSGIPKASKKEGGVKGMLNEKQQKRLLEIARQAMELYVKEGKTLQVTETDPELTRIGGAFVTLKKHGQLRGCIGHIIGREPLYLTVRDMAIASAAQDPRFMPVTERELKDIEIEISVLSEPQKIKDVNEIKMGVHGVIVERGGRSGVYLPQVATETGWTREQFLSSLCAHKAGLPADAWKDKETDIYIFTAQVFQEKR